jgi:hypothetical protein
LDKLKLSDMNVLRELLLYGYNAVLAWQIQMLPFWNRHVKTKLKSELTSVIWTKMCSLDFSIKWRWIVCFMLHAHAHASCT